MKSEKFTPQLRFHPGQGTQQAIWWNRPAEARVVAFQSDHLSNPAAQPCSRYQHRCNNQTPTAATPRGFFFSQLGLCCPNTDKREGTHISGLATHSSGNHGISHQVDSNVSMSWLVHWYL